LPQRNAHARREGHRAAIPALTGGILPPCKTRLPERIEPEWGDLSGLTRASRALDGLSKPARPDSRPKPARWADARVPGFYQVFPNTSYGCVLIINIQVGISTYQR
jgi:hypothetical protein